MAPSARWLVPDKPRRHHANQPAARLKCSCKNEDYMYSKLLRKQNRTLTLFSHVANPQVTLEHLQSLWKPRHNNTEQTESQARWRASEFRDSESNSYPPGPSRRCYGCTAVAGDDGGRSRQCLCFHRLSHGAFSSIPEAAFRSAQRRTSAFRRDVPLLKRSQWDKNPQNKKCRIRQVTEMCPAETRGGKRRRHHHWSNRRRKEKLSVISLTHGHKSLSQSPVFVWRIHPHPPPQTTVCPTHITWLRFSLLPLFQDLDRNSSMWTALNALWY